MSIIQRLRYYFGSCPRIDRGYKCQMFYPNGCECGRKYIKNDIKLA